MFKMLIARLICRTMVTCFVQQLNLHSCFQVYNANVNLFASVVLLLEKSPNGAFFAYPVISPIRLYDFIDGLGTFLVAIYVLFVIICAYNLQKVSHDTWGFNLPHFHGN